MPLPGALVEIPPLVAGAEPARLQNGFVAGPGIAHATGAIHYRKTSPGEDTWVLAGSGVLVAPNAILTAAHCFQHKEKPAEDYRFFLPGVGGIRFREGWTTDEAQKNFCIPFAGQYQNLAADLALVVLEEPVHLIKPVRPPAEDWSLADGEAARVSGFGTSSDVPTRITGLRQYADIPMMGSLESPQRLRLAPTVVRYDWRDSGGPVVLHRTRELIGIAVEKIPGASADLPSEAIRLSGETLSWIHNRLEFIGKAPRATTTGKLGCLFCPVSDQQILKENETEALRIGLLKNEKLIVTFNGVVGRPVALEIAPAGTEPDLSQASTGFHDTKPRDVTDEEDLYVWVQARLTTLAQIFFSRHRQLGDRKR